MSSLQHHWNHGDFSDRITPDLRQQRKSGAQHLAVTDRAWRMAWPLAYVLGALVVLAVVLVAVTG
jgi:hypothetical protein